MTGLTLYQCSAEVQSALDAALDRETGELVTTEELDNAIGQFRNKGAAVAAYVLNLDASIDAIKAHEKAIVERRKAVERKATRIREFMAYCMKMSGIDSIEATDGTFSAKFYPDRDESIEIDADAKPADGFKRTKITEEWDKAALKAAIKAGEPVPSCVRLVKRDRLTIG
jgi:Siphovirus Gp157